jgi:hypothetical protein
MQEEHFSQETPHQESRPVFGLWGVLVAVLLLAAVVSLGFVVHEHGVAKQLSTQNSTMAASLDQTRNRLDEVTAKLNDLTAAQAAADAARERAQEKAAELRRNHVRRDDPRWKKVQAELDEHQKQIESTQSDLTNARSELSGSIARTHEELVALAKRGERSYFEFDLNKSKQFQREGPISVSLRKANAKHDFADLALIVDDAQITKKHVNVFEPVMLYPASSKQAVELVINQVGKDRIHGYVSTPRYKPAELPALSSLSEGDSNSSAPAGEPQLQNRRQ